MNQSKIIEIVNDSTTFIFKRQVGVQITSMDEMDIPLEGYQFVAVSVLTSKKLECCLGLGFSMENYLKYVSIMFDEQYTQLNDDIKDLAHEWVNLILGHAKKILNDELGGEFTNTIPINVIGQNLTIQNPKGHQLKTFKYKSDTAFFSVFFNFGPELILPWDKQQSGK